MIVLLWNLSALNNVAFVSDSNALIYRKQLLRSSLKVPEEESRTPLEGNILVDSRKN